MNWIKFDIKDKTTWPDKLDDVLIRTNWAFYVARIINDRTDGEIVFECNVNPFRYIQLTVVTHWSKIEKPKG